MGRLDPSSGLAEADDFQIGDCMTQMSLKSMKGYKFAQIKYTSSNSVK